MTEAERRQRATELMRGFAERTGLSSDRKQQRYLWTDAFAVCNLLGLAQASGDPEYGELALRLIDRVHDVLGRHRGDDGRTGWISGLDARAGAEHPTRGGLRIGKPLPERAPGAVFDERLEWDRDGQYFHYLVQWMHALDQAARATGKPVFNRWARELAAAAFRGFSYVTHGGKPRRMYWKMSIDLSRPLVTSMGQHDPLDGYLVYSELEASAVRVPDARPEPRLTDEISALAAMVDSRELATDDPLGLGGLLIDALRVHALEREGANVRNDLLESLLAAALSGLASYTSEGELRSPAARRLAFRELGLAIGLRAAERMLREVEQSASVFAGRAGVRARLAALEPYLTLATTIEAFWLEPAHEAVASWTEHRDINEVMLATSLLPDGYLVRK